MSSSTNKKEPAASALNLRHKWTRLACAFTLLLTPPSAFAVEPLADRALRGGAYPHILQTESYTFNAHNIKSLKAQGKFLWAGTSMGAIRFDTQSPENHVIYDNRNGLLSNGVFTIALDARAQPWIGTYGGGISRRVNDKWVNINTPQGLADAFVFDIEFTPRETWIATWSGANRAPAGRRIKKWETFTVENTRGGLIDNWVYAIEAGPDGRIWLGTEGGLSLFDGSEWRSWSHANGLGAPPDLVKNQNENIMSAFYGSHHAGAPTHKDASPNPAYRPNYILCMLRSRDGNLWIGTWGGGLSFFDTQRFTFRNLTTHDGLPGNYILALREDHHGNLWIGTSKGLSRFDGSGFLNFTTRNGLSGDFIFSLETTPDHSLWIGGRQSLDRLIIDPQTRLPIKRD